MKQKHDMLAGITVAEEPKPGSPRAKTMYASVNVTMPTAKICRNWTEGIVVLSIFLFYSYFEVVIPKSLWSLTRNEATLNCLYSAFFVEVVASQSVCASHLFLLSSHSRTSFDRGKTKKKIILKRIRYMFFFCTYAPLPHKSIRSILDSVLIF